MSENDPWKDVLRVSLNGQQTHSAYHVYMADAVDAARAAEATQHQQEIAAKDAHIANLEHMVREHGQFGDLFQPGGRFHREAQLEPGSVAVVAGGKWLVARLAAVEAERDQLYPTPEPETCEWRITTGPLGIWVTPFCVEGSIPAPWGTERAKSCHLCGKPLRLVPAKEQNQ